MDSKMDSGYLGPGQDQNLEDDYDTTRDLSAEEILGVMDELLCYEVRAQPCFFFFFLRYIRQIAETVLAIWSRWLGIWDTLFRKRS